MMTAQAQTLPAQSSTAHRAVQADSIFCMLSGAAFTFGAGGISSFIGLDSSTPILLIGLIVLICGVGAFWLTINRPVDRRLVVAALVVNIAWVIGSVLLLAADPFSFTTGGKWLVLILADIVAALAIWEFVGLRRMK
jgi:hypothetical protein